MGSWVSEEFAGAGTWNHSWPGDERERLRGSVEGIPHRASDGHTEDLHTLGLDGSGSVTPTRRGYR
ncbi:hypothetical protein [Streptomyces sp. NPDC057496]|uniref:hypothetical protein n=1 Tax=Streptomyces sp. NPDC057496 TaxID=3346149 RepID=UPI003691EB71